MTESSTATGPSASGPAASGRLPLTFLTQGGNRDHRLAIDIAKAADAAGFSGIGFADRPHDPQLDGWTLATVVAARTERIRVFHATLNVPFRYPALVAKAAATLDRISDGRLDLALGAGGEGNRGLYRSVGVELAAPGERLRDLEDAVAILRGMWSQPTFSYRGRSFFVDEAVGPPAPVQQPIPIWLAGLLPRSIDIVGRLGDGFMRNGGWAGVADVAESNRQVDAAAVRAGRDPRGIRRVLNGPAFVGTRREVEAYLARSGGGPASGSNQPDGLVGTLDEVLEVVRTYRTEGGVDAFNARFEMADAVEQVGRFGRDIIPATASW
jgi:alkanesulfonate monooxygenase SsuD/methylene tetrahydromethanopterin reductase-like flavin-dependent oxidoreductase (luciferase family)